MENYQSKWQLYAPGGGDDFQADEGDDFIEEGNSEGILERIVKSARGPMGLPSSPLGMLPTSGQEAMDVGRVGLGNTLGMVNPFGSSISPMSMGANMADKRGSVIGVPQIEEMMRPQTEYGQGLDISAKGAMLATPFAMNPALGGQMLGSAKKGLGGIVDFFSAGKLNKAKFMLPVETAAKETMLGEVQARDLKNIGAKFGESPQRPGVGKIGQELTIQQQLAEEANLTRQKYASDLAKRKEIVMGDKTANASSYKKAKDELTTASNELALTGSEEARAAMKAKSNAFHDMYEQGLSDAMGEGITREELATRVREIAKAQGLDSRAILEGDEAVLKNLGNEVHPQLPQGATAEQIAEHAKRGQQILGPDDVKAWFRNLRGRMNTHGNPLTEIYKGAGDLVAEKMPIYEKLREDYKPMYQMIKDTNKYLGESGIGKLTKGTVAPTRFSRAEALEKELGINITSKAKDIATKRNEIVKQFGLKTSDLRDIKDAQLNKIHKKILASGERKLNLIHEMKAEIAKAKLAHEARISKVKGGAESKKNFIQDEIGKRTLRKAIAGILGGGAVTKGLGLFGGSSSTQNISNIYQGME